MAKQLNEKALEWYYSALESLGNHAVTLDKEHATVTYNSAIHSDESHIKPVGPEEFVHAITTSLLTGSHYKYPIASIGHEVYFAHGSKGSKSDEVDFVIRDADELPYAVIELKSAADYLAERDDAIKNQLFGTAPLVGLPKLLVYGTVEPWGKQPNLRAICIDYAKFKSYSDWKDAGEPHSTIFPVDYHDLGFEPYVYKGD